MSASRLKNAAVLGIALVLGSLGIYNIVLKATWTLMDDGVFWKQGPQGLYAARVAAGGPGDKAGVRPGDTVLAVDGEEALSPADLQSRLAGKASGETITYSLLRADERRGGAAGGGPPPPGHATPPLSPSLGWLFYPSP